MVTVITVNIFPLVGGWGVFPFVKQLGRCGSDPVIWVIQRGIKAERVGEGTPPPPPTPCLKAPWGPALLQLKGHLLAVPGSRPLQRTVTYTYWRLSLET